MVAPEADSLPALSIANAFKVYSPLSVKFAGAPFTVRMNNIYYGITWIRHNSIGSFVPFND